MADLLRETFDDYARRAPDAGGLKEAVDARVRTLRGRRRWVAVTAAAAAALTVVAGAAVLRGDRTAEPPPNVLVTPPADPPGARLVHWRGLRVAVPERFFAGRFDACGTPETDVVVLGDVPAEGQCASVPPRGITVVSFLDEAAAREVTRGRVELTTLDGIPARRATGLTGDDREAAYVSVAVRNATVLVTGDQAVAKRILDSVRVTPGATDARGCPVRYEPVHATTPPARAGGTERMVPDAPAQASVCRYARDGFVTVSKLVEADGARTVAAALNTLATPGLAPPDPKRTGGTWFVVVFRYESGPEVVVTLRSDGPEGVGASNGAVTGRVDEGIAQALQPIVGWRYTYEQDRVG